MISNLTNAGVSVPKGFATTADAYREFLNYDGLDDRIATALFGLNVDDIKALTTIGEQIRQWILEAPLPPLLAEAVRKALIELQEGNESVALAVRSSATAEDLPDASFAGQQETHLNIVGVENVLHAIRDVFASLFTDRAIAYRQHQGLDHHNIALSAGIQRGDVYAGYRIRFRSSGICYILIWTG
jgi:pyruvate,water dikinase